MMVKYTELFFFLYLYFCKWTWFDDGFSLKGWDWLKKLNKNKNQRWLFELKFECFVWMTTLFDHHLKRGKSFFKKNIEIKKKFIIHFSLCFCVISFFFFFEVIFLITAHNSFPGSWWSTFAFCIWPDIQVDGCWSHPSSFAGWVRPRPHTSFQVQSKQHRQELAPGRGR